MKMKQYLDKNGVAPLNGKLQRNRVVVPVVVEHAQRLLLENAGREDGGAKVEAP